jgi:hypothetical protein
MSGILNTTGAVSGIIGTTVGTPAGGITEADIWRNTSDQYLFREPIATWERTDTYGFYSTTDLLGTGMSESSGIFTFPSTGWWNIQAILNIYFDGETRFSYMRMKWSSDSGSSWDTASESACFTSDEAQNSGAVSASAVTGGIIKITNATTQRIRFDHYGENSSVYMRGNSTANQTWASFIKLANA